MMMASDVNPVNPVTCRCATPPFVVAAVMGAGRALGARAEAEATPEIIVL